MTAPRRRSSERVFPGKAWAWMIDANAHKHFGENPKWALCHWACESRARLLDDDKPSPEARAVPVLILRARARGKTGERGMDADALWKRYDELRADHYDLEALEILVRECVQSERTAVAEECAKIAEERILYEKNADGSLYTSDETLDAADIAAAIRSRFNIPEEG